MSKNKITIIIPASNEINTIQTVINKVVRLKISKQIIVIDDHSTDGTREIVLKNEKKIDKIILHKKNKGKGAAIKSAQKYINGKYVIIQDADLEYNPSDIHILLKEIGNKKVKVIYGSRVLNNEKNKKAQNFSHSIRIIGNIFLTKLSNIINKQNLTDAHTCYKLFESNLFKSIQSNEKDFSFCPEITTKLSILNEKILEVPINYRGRTYNQGKKIKASDGLKAIYVLLKYRYFKC